MRLGRDEFLQQLADSGLLAPDDLRPFSESSAAQTPEAIAQDLVRRKKLTLYQAQQVAAGKARALFLGNYVILDKLGQGGMGLVLLAEHRRMKRTVALKLLSPAVTKNPHSIARFQREVEASARLDHPNIVTAHDAGEADGRHFYVMQHVAGSDLASLVKKAGPLSVARAVDYVLQAARGLDYAHEQGIIHRDIKPANLLLDRHGVVKILDMGLARIADDVNVQAELTNTGAVLGTIDYMAPEQALNSKEADARADIYSLGMTLWFLLTGRPAYEGSTLTARLMAHQTQPIPSLTQSVSAGLDDQELVRNLEPVFSRMVAKQLSDRYQSMKEVIGALEPCLGAAVSLSGASQVSATLSRSANLSRSGSAVTARPPGSTSGSVRSVSPPPPPPPPLSTVETKSEVASLTQQDLIAGSTPRSAQPRVRWMLGTAAASLLLAAAAFGVWSTVQEPEKVPEPPAASTSTSTTSKATDSREQNPSAPVTLAGETALHLARSGDHVELPDFDMDLANGFTAEAWITDLGGTHTVQIWYAKSTNGRDHLNFYRESSLGLETVRYGIERRGFATHAPGRSRFHVAMSWFRLKGDIIVVLFVDGRVQQRFKMAGGSKVGRGPKSSVWLTDFVLGRVMTGEPDTGGLLLHQARFSESVRYIAEFTPEKTLETDRITLVLYHFDRDSGPTVSDLSNNHHDGKIVHARWVSVENQDRE